MFIKILPSVTGALLTLVRGSIPGCCTPCLTSGDMAAFTIGLVDSAWPDIPSSRKIILVAYGVAHTVSPGSHLFYDDTMRHVDNPATTLTHFLRERAAGGGD